MSKRRIGPSPSAVRAKAFRLAVPPDDCRVIALAEVRDGEKVLVSTSRHVTSPVFDELNPRSVDIPGETLVRRYYSPRDGFVCGN